MSALGPAADAGVGAGARRLHPAALVTGIVQQLRQSILALLPVAGSLLADRPFISTPIALAIVGAIILFPTLGWLRFRYTIGADALVIERGVLSRHRRVIPYERVQDIDVERGPIGRATGTARVTVETGASGEDEGKLDGLTLAEVDRLRTALRDWRGAHATDAATPTGAPVAAPPPERPLYAMSTGRVVLAGVLGFSLVWIAGIFVLAQWIEPLVEDTRYDIFDRFQNAVADWRDGNRADGRALFSLAGAILVAWFLAFAVALGVATGIVLSVLRDHGFRLGATPLGLRIRRGLVTLRETQVPRARIQRARLVQRLLTRPFGLWRVELGTLGAGPGAGRQKSGAHIVAPLATAAEAGAILGDIGIDSHVPADAWRRGHGLLVLARAIRIGVPTLGGLVAVAIASTFAAPLLLVFAPVAVLAWAAWRSERHAIVGDALHVSTGILSKRHAIVPLARLQGVLVRRGPLERLLGLSTLTADVAGGSGAPAGISGLVPEDAAALMRALLDGRSARPALDGKLEQQQDDTRQQHQHANTVQ